jgi:hypothetical protein
MPIELDVKLGPCPRCGKTEYLVIPSDPPEIWCTECDDRVILVADGVCLQ